MSVNEECSNICANCKHSERVDSDSVWCYKEQLFFRLHRKACDEYE